MVHAALYLALMGLLKDLALVDVYKGQERDWGGHDVLPMPCILVDFLPFRPDKTKGGSCLYGTQGILLHVCTESYSSTTSSSDDSERGTALDNYFGLTEKVALSVQSAGYDIEEIQFDSEHTNVAVNIVQISTIIEF